MLLCIVSVFGQQRIVGGHDATLGQFVHQGFARDYARNYLCGAWIQSEKWAIAPAYYMNGRSISNTYVVFGTVTVDQGGHEYSLSEIVVHPNFNVYTLESNLALLHIEDYIIFYPYVHPVPLGNEFTRGGVIVTMAGWAQGEVSRIGEGIILLKLIGLIYFQNEMQHISTRTLTTAECQARHPPEYQARITDHVICVDTQEGYGACLSSAGSALIAGDAIIGSMSWGINCTEGGYPDVYSRISYYYPWIRSVITTHVD